ncbi:ribonuclease T1 [Gyrodon lividus]|nr:ribonuclease T1 [Gyrodon lividus]
MRLYILALLSVSFVGSSHALLSRGRTQDCDCPDASYNSRDIMEAINMATSRNGRDYPHQYHNYEGISFPSCHGELLEYPLKKMGVYKGTGSPGADRVIYDKTHDFCGCIAHGSDKSGPFVQCK